MASKRPWRRRRRRAAACWRRAGGGWRIGGPRCMGAPRCLRLNISSCALPRAGSEQINAAAIALVKKKKIEGANKKKA